MPASPTTALPLTTDSDPRWLREWLRSLPEASQSPRPWISLSLPLPPLDVLAALPVLTELCQRTTPPWHFYLAQPSNQQAILGLDILHQHQAQGHGRFQRIKHYCQQTLGQIRTYSPPTPPLARPESNGCGHSETLAQVGHPRIFCSFSFFEHPLPKTSKQPLDRVIFPEAWALLPRWQISQFGALTVLTLNAGHPTTEADWQTLCSQLLQAWSTLQDLPPIAATHPISLTVPNLEHQAALFQTQVQTALTQIADNHLEKLVLACAVDVEANRELQGLVTVDRLRQRYPSCYSFSLSNGLGETFLGASPERLVSLEAGQLVVDALAGSAPRSQHPEEDQSLGQGLQRSPKDLREHRVIVEFLHQALQDFSDNISLPSQPTLFRLANIQHLQTLIQAWVNAEVHLLDIVARLHPTPAVAGYPQAKACELLSHQEEWSRGLYGAPLGWVNAAGEGEFIVGIRSALLAGHQARVYGGAGIVAGSAPEREWEEILLKLKTLLTTLA